MVFWGGEEHFPRETIPGGASNARDHLYASSETLSSPFQTMRACQSDRPNSGKTPPPKQLLNSLLTPKYRTKQFPNIFWGCWCAVLQHFVDITSTGNV